MNKSALIERVAEETGFSQKETEKLLLSLTHIVVKTLKRGERVVLAGFGTFLLSRRVKRKGRNPQTGETLMIEAQRLPRFRPGKEFKHLIGG